MKTVKSLLLGCAAAVTGAVAAQAADLAAPEPVEYVRVCDAYGAGFFFIPGTDTCLKISGYVRAYYAFLSNNQTNYTEGTVRTRIAGSDGIDGTPGTIQTPAFVNLPVVGFGGATRVFGNAGNTPTVIANSYAQYGVQTIGGAVTPTSSTTGAGPSTGSVFTVPGATPFTLFGHTVLNDQYNNGIRAAMTFDARSRTEWGVLRSFFQFAANSDNFGQNGDALQLRYGFIQLGPITAGLTESWFDGDLTDFWVPSVIGDRFRRTTFISYTGAFGNGISATIALENSTQAEGTGGQQTALLTSGAGASWVRTSVQLPDLVGQLRVQQDWGAAWLVGAASQLRFSNTTCALGANALCSATKTGWAIGAGANIKLDALGRGDHFLIKAAYADGALDYLGNVTRASFWGSGINPITGTGTGTGLNSINGWSVVAEFQHFFTPAVSAAIGGGYFQIYPSLNGSLGTDLVFQKSGFTLDGQVEWHPVKNVNLGVEVFYANGRWDAFSGASGINATTVGHATDDSWGTILYLHRYF